MNFRAFLRLLVSAIASVVLYACGGGGGGGAAGSPSPLPPAPTTLRTDLYFGYYGTMADPTTGGTVSEVASHANLAWVMGWGNYPDAMQNFVADLALARQLGLKTVLGVPVSYVAPAEMNTRNFFTALRNVGVLDSNIVALYPIDEPDGASKSEEEIAATNAMIRKLVAEEFPELSKAALAVIYTGGREWPGIETYDWVGFDDYNHGDLVLTNDTWRDMKNRLRPTQRIIVVPGGANPWRMRPDAFFNVAQSDLQVIALVAFKWFDGGDGLGTGIRSNGMAPQYIAAGLRIKNSTP